jgi:hypothetical protein
MLKRSRQNIYSREKERTPGVNWHKESFAAAPGVNWHKESFAAAFVGI